jgi:hypothetical protein
MLKTAHWTSLPASVWKPGPFVEQLAEDPGDYAIAELPMGMGHGSALLQVVHGKRRAEGHHDEMARLTLHRPPPSECFTLPFLQALWYLGSAEGAEVVEAGFQPEAIAAARRAGFRYVLVYRKVYAGSMGQQLGLDLPAVEKVLSDHLGPPTWVDPEVAAWTLPETPAAGTTTPG